MLINNFHFLRPWWLIAIIPAILLMIAYVKKSTTSNNIWHEYCDEHLLNHLLVNKAGTNNNKYLASIILLIFVLLITALAGPTWSMYASDVYQKNSARVIALNVSPTMNNTDIAPSRLDRAKYKILDLLKLYKEGQTGLIAFSSEAFVVTPLTSDNKTITNLIPAIDSSIMPVQGVNIGNALFKSAQLIKNAGFSQGEIILITDSQPTSADEAIAKQLASEGYITNTLIMTNNTNMQNDFKQFSNDSDGHAISFTKNNNDVNEISSFNNNSDNAQKTNHKLNDATMWKDEGHWLIWLAMLIIILLLSRKGWFNKLC